MIGLKARRSAATAAFSVAASTSPVIRIRAPAANSISIAPPLASLAGLCAALGVRNHSRWHDAQLVRGDFLRLGAIYRN
jgi:hypothetical protein